MIPAYQNILTPQEYETYVKLGASLAQASIPEMEKDAAIGDVTGALSTLGNYSTQMLLTLSVVTGIPAGIMLHVVGKRIGERRAADKAMMDEAGYYSNAAKGLESEMARQGVKVSEASNSFITNGLEDDPRSPIPKSGMGKLKPMLNNPPKAADNIKMSEALRALKKFAQDSEMETGDEDNAAQPTGAPGLLVEEPGALLKAVGEVPKQQAPDNPEVVAKSNITAPGEMPSGSQRSQLS